MSAPASEVYPDWEKATPEERRAIVRRIREAAERQALALKDMPREEVAAQFLETLERIRQQAIEKGTAIDDDLEWLESQADAPRRARC